MARTNNIVNPYYREGWSDWTLVRSNGDNMIETVDSIKYGLMTGRGNPCQFPTVGNSYMLLARRLEMVVDTTSGVNLLTLASGNVALSEGDVIAADIGYELSYTQFSNVNVSIKIGASGGAGTTEYYPPEIEGIMRQTLAHRVATSATATLLIYLAIGQGTGDTDDTMDMDWVSVDNWRIYSAVDNYTLAEANDATGVS